MRTIVAVEFVTVDGVMENPTWSQPFRSAYGARMQRDLLFASDALLLGRVTYEELAEAWPMMEGTGDFGERMNALPKHVASTTMTTMTWNATPIRGDVPEAVAALKQREGQGLLIYGSATLVQTLLGAGKIDEYRLMVFPVVVGSGKRLFADGGTPATLALADVQTTPTGVVVLTYRPASTRTHGEPAAFA